MRQDINSEASNIEGDVVPSERHKARFEKQRKKFKQ